MTIRNTAVKIAAVTALPLVVGATAHAQVADLRSAATLSYSSASHETWHTVLLISGILLLAGLIDSDSGLIIIGGAGVLIAESETNGNAYRSSIGHSLDFYHAGRLSFGVNPFGQMGLQQGLHQPRPNLTIQAKFKF